MNDLMRRQSRGDDALARISIGNIGQHQRSSVPTALFLCLIALIILGGTNDTLLARYQFVFIGAFLVWSVLRALFTPRRLTHREKLVLGAMALTCATTVFGLFVSLEKALTLRISLYFLIYFLCMLCYQKTSVYVRLFNCIRVCAPVLGLTIILSAILKGTFVSIFSFWLTNGDRVALDIRYGQFSGLIGDRSFAAIAMCTGIYAEFAAVFAGARLTKRSLVSIAICLVAMLLTGKRITIIMLLGGLLIVMLLSNSRKIRKAVIGILAVLIVLAAIAMAVLPQTQVALYRVVEGLSDTTFNDRIHFWTTAWDMFLQKPVFGWGLGSYLSYNYLFGDGIRQYAHNMYLQLLAERGIVGTALTLFVFIASFIVTLQTLRVKSRENVRNGQTTKPYGKADIGYTLCMFSLMSQVGFLIYGMTGYPIYNLHQGFFYAICVAMVLSIRVEMRNIKR